MHGYKAQPLSEQEAEVSFVISGDTKLNVQNAPHIFSLEPKSFSSIFDTSEQGWKSDTERPKGNGIVLYAMPDGSFGLWDSIRNNGKTADKKRPSAYIFSPEELWHGLKSEEGATLCNGLILDWALWQKENNHSFERLQKTLCFLSASKDEQLTIGELTRISLEDVRDMPTIKMPYGEEVPVVCASSAIKRVLSLAYLLVWALIEHEKASKQLRQATLEYAVRAHLRQNQYLPH